ncbi:MAG: FHA domain-containing protein [Polyangiaceae bacterium]
MVWKLVIEDDEGKRTTVPLTREAYTIGRKEGNTIRLTERNVSRDHAKLQKRNMNGAAAGMNGNGNGASYALEDCSSYNGVYVNGIRVATPQDLTHGDLIQIGDYRILIQDDAVAEPQAEPVLAVSGEVPAAQPQIQAATRGSMMLERPNRLVMLAGPTPGMEYPLGSDRVTVGRAEDATISVNHNSVSRLHCEIHALSEGRYEIVDKGSSNGVRVNGSDLRRGIVEAGDIIELGDVRFKFVGQGQIFLPGVNDSQQLESISDRVADAALGRRRSSGGVIAMVVIAMFALVGFVGFIFLKHKTGGATTDPTSASPDDATTAVLASAKALCAQGNCEAAHDKLLLGIPDGSPARDTADFKAIEASWADMMLDRENNEPDPMRKQSILKMVSATPTVDAGRRKIADDRLAALQTPTATASTTNTPPPIPTQPDGVPTHIASIGPTPTPEHPPTATTSTTPRTHNTSSTAAGNGSVADQARALMLKDPNGAKNLLMPRVAAKKATPEEVTLLKAVCKSLKDYECVNMCKAQLGD